MQDKSKDIANLNEQLTLLGLKVVPVTADGNCFFRFISKLLMCQKKSDFGSVWMPFVRAEESCK